MRVMNPISTKQAVMHFQSLFTLALFPLLLLSFNQAKERQTISLFNGKDLRGWHIDVPDMDKDSSLQSPFLIRNGMLVSMGEPNGHIITELSMKILNLKWITGLLACPAIVGFWYLRLRPVRYMRCFPNLLRSR